MRQFIELLKTQGQQGQQGHHAANPAMVRAAQELGSLNHPGARQGQRGREISYYPEPPPSAPALPSRLTRLKGAPRTPNGAASSEIAPSAPAAPAIFDKSEHIAAKRPAVTVWHFTIDGKHVTAIDYERRTYPEMLADMQSKFGAERVTGLELRG